MPSGHVDVGRISDENGDYTNDICDDDCDLVGNDDCDMTMMGWWNDCGMRWMMMMIMAWRWCVGIPAVRTPWFPFLRVADTRQPAPGLFSIIGGHHHGLPAYSHHDRFPPWWGFVRDDNDGNLSGDKIPPLTMIIINHLTQFKSSHWWWLSIIWLSSTRLNYTMLCYKKEL